MKSGFSIKILISDGLSFGSNFRDYDIFSSKRVWLWLVSSYYNRLKNSLFSTDQRVYVVRARQAV